MSEAVNPAMRRWRIALVVVGLALLATGVGTLLSEVPPSRYPAIGLWLLGALVIHDGIGAMVVFGVSVVLRRAERQVPFGVVLVVQSALAIAAVVTVLVLPEIIKKGIGTANPSILPLDYALALLLFHAALAAVSALLIAGVLMRRALRRSR